MKNNNEQNPKRDGIDWEELEHILQSRLDGTGKSIMIIMNDNDLAYRYYVYGDKKHLANAVIGAFLEKSAVGEILVDAVGAIGDATADALEIMMLRKMDMDGGSMPEA